MRALDQVVSCHDYNLGNAVYLFAIEANYVPLNRATTFSNLTFMLDGDVVATHVHIPDNSSKEVSYNVPIYTNTSLQHGDHSIVIYQAAKSTNDQDHTLLLFDRAIYTCVFLFYSCAVTDRSMYQL